MATNEKTEVLRTEHGENIANQINASDAYGRSGVLTYADVWSIVDNIHSNLMDGSGTLNAKLMRRMEKWMRELEKDLPEMETI